MNFNKINLLEKFKSEDALGKFFIIICILLILIAVFIGCGYGVGSFIKVFSELFKSETELTMSIWHYAFFTELGLITTTCLFLILFFAVIIFAFRQGSRRNSILTTDNRGVSYMKNGTDGSSVWMTKEEAKEVFTVCDIKDTTTQIYGQFSEGGKEICGYKKPKFGGEGDRNTFIIGSPGTGKSYVYVRTELIQTVLRGDSFVVTDPSGELFTTMAKFCRKNNYDVKVLNLVEPKYSDTWNCLLETLDPDTERLDATRLNDFISIYLKNASADMKEDYWYYGASNTFKVLIAYCSWQRELDVILNLRSLCEKVLEFSKDSEEKSFIKKIDPMQQISIRLIKDKIVEFSEKYGYNKEEIQKIIRKIELDAPKYTISEVFKKSLDASELLTDEKLKIDSVPKWHPLFIAYKMFKQKEDVNIGHINGLQQKMNLFSDVALSEMLSNDGIELKNLNNTKSAYFVIMSDTTNTTKPISSLFFSFLFKDVQYEWDKAQHIADAQGVPNPRKAVTIMLDEFFSIGVIGGDQNQFTTTMSNSRKRRLYISIIVQNYLQVETLYGRSNSTTIQSCCGTIIYLGSNDPETAKYISNFASGEATVLNESHTDNATGLIPQVDNNIHVSTKKRQLLTIDEARRWRNRILIVKAGEHPLELKPFPWVDHPMAKFIEFENIYNAITPIDVRILNNANTYNKEFPFTLEVMIRELSSSFKKSEEIKNEDSIQGIEPLKKEFKLLDIDEMFMNEEDYIDNNLNIKSNSDIANDTSTSYKEDELDVKTENEDFVIEQTSLFDSKSEEEMLKGRFKKTDENINKILPKNKRKFVLPKNEFKN